MSEFQPFDEQDAIEYIRAMIPRDIAIRIDDDDILFVIDHVWDWYEQHGFLDISLDDADDPEVDPDTIVEYVQKFVARRRNLSITTEDVKPIVLAQLDYERSLEDF